MTIHAVGKPILARVALEDKAEDERIRQCQAAHNFIKHEYEKGIKDREELDYVAHGLGALDREMSTFDGLASNVLLAFRQLSSQFYYPGLEGSKFAIDIAPRVHAASRYMGVLTSQARHYFDLAPDQAMRKYDITMNRARDALRQLNVAICTEPANKERIGTDTRYRLTIAPTRFFPHRRTIVARTIPLSLPSNLDTYSEGFRTVYAATSPAALEEARSYYNDPTH